MDLREQLLDGEILIVDDNRANVILLEAVLRAAGFRRLQSLTDSRQVCALQAERDFDLILLDVHMPHRDGLDILEELARCRRGAYLPVIMLTAQTDRETRIRALSSGAKDFITKPFDAHEVLRRVENVLTARLLLKDREREAERLEQAVRERTRELAESRVEIIRSLARAGEYRDNETGRHILRMSRTARLLALAAGLDAAFADMLLEASPMHDVGKIGIPDAILLKPGKLTPEEFETMKRHPEIGAGIIADCTTPLLCLARGVAMTHHEKWDGSGYPRGLKGEDIPIAGRIVAICDVFDALTSARPYKKAWSVEEAVAYIRDNAGRHFDPRLVDLFIGILPAVLDVHHQFADAAEPVELT